MINIRKLEADLWESADLLRAESKLNSNQYCMPACYDDTFLTESRQQIYEYVYSKYSHIATV